MADHDLYQTIILEHARAPRQHVALPKPAISRHGVNSLCGDEITVYLRRDALGVVEASFTSHGCALCRASASVLMEATKGLDKPALKTLIAQFCYGFLEMSTPPPRSPAPLAALYDLRPFASRTRCVLLAWKTMETLLDEWTDS